MKFKNIAFVFYVFIAANFWSQKDTLLFNSSFSSNLSNVKNPISQLSFSGNYRFLGFVRSQEKVFPSNSGKTTSLLKNILRGIR